MFEFYRYIKPDEYRLAPTAKVHAHMRLPDFRTVPKHLLRELRWQEEYHTEEALLADAGFQLWKRGYRYAEATRPLPDDVWVRDVEDNYRFLCAWFGRKWALYVLWLRVQEGHPWLPEWRAFARVKNTPREGLSPLPGGEEATTRDGEPQVSVVIATRNRPEYLAAILEDLATQDYPPAEVIVVDQSDGARGEVAATRYLAQPGQRGQWTARNAGVEQARGEYLAFLDDDVRVGRGWLAEHLRLMAAWGADVSTGDYVPEGTPAVQEGRPAHYASQWNANNSVMHRSVWEAVGPFDEAYDGTRWGDHAFGMEAFRAGFRLVSNPYAVAEDRRAPRGGLRLGEEASYTAYRSRAGKRPARGVARYFRTYFDTTAFRRWVHTRIPWQGRGGIFLPGRLAAYWLRRALGQRLERGPAEASQASSPPNGPYQS